MTDSNKIVYTGLGAGGGGGSTTAAVTVPITSSVITYANTYVSTKNVGEEGNILVFEGGSPVWKTPIEALISSELSRENELVAKTAEKLRKAYRDYVMCVKLVNERKEL